MSRTLRIDETGNRYGSLVVTGVVYRPLESRIKRSKAKWFCKCDCGEVTAVFGDKLRNGHIKNCLKCEREIRNKPMDTLVKRLRKEQQWGNSLDGEAADRIEELEALVEKYRDATVQIARWITTGEIPK
jgi:hypothetical protein